MDVQGYARAFDRVLGLEEFAARPDVDPVARALLVHLEFVTVHPFIDGNGRLGRLLMNYELIANGLPWGRYGRTRECRSFGPSNGRRWRTIPGRSSGICGI